MAADDNGIFYRTGIKPDTRILIVDDEMALRAVLSEVLADDGYEVTEAASGEEALDLFRQDPYPLVITDIVMEGISGIELLQEIKKTHPDTQVVIITSNASLDTAITALRSGAYDYLIKPFDEIDMISVVAGRAIEKISLIAENRELLERLHKKNEEMEEANKVLEEMAIRDGLTGLFNHRYFQEALTVELLRSRRHGRTFSLILIDVDNFKQYNDTHGHPEGDRLLSTLAQLMGKNLRRSDLVARYGGEEFVIILPEASRRQALGVAEGIRKNISEYAFHGRKEQPGGRVTVSLGVAAFPRDGTDGSTLIKRADQALYRAKKSGRNTVC